MKIFPIEAFKSLKKTIENAMVTAILTSLFSITGMPTYIYSDPGASFMSKELREFLTTKGIATSRTTSYNPGGNGQAERCNVVVWKAVTISLKSKNLSPRNWQDVFPNVLHSIRSLLKHLTSASLVSHDDHPLVPQSPHG